jgi:hypothetical protein
MKIITNRQYFQILKILSIFHGGKMAEADLQAALDTIQADVTQVVAQSQQQAATIAQLEAQVAAGSPVTADQLASLTAEAQSIVASLNAVVVPPATSNAVATPPKPAA